jgi:hypothetical protein
MLLISIITRDTPVHPILDSRQIFSCSVLTWITVESVKETGNLAANALPRIALAANVTLSLELPFTHPWSAQLRPMLAITLSAMSIMEPAHYNQ